MLGLLARAEQWLAGWYSAEVAKAQVSTVNAEHTTAACFEPMPRGLPRFVCSRGDAVKPWSATQAIASPREAGFSLVELAFTLAIICVVVVVVFEAYANAYPAFRATSAVSLLQAQLRQARQVSIDQRRSVTVTFQGTAELVAVVQGINGASNTTIYDYLLPEGLKFVLLSGVPDTPAPDNYGNSYAVNYACPGHTLPCTITFQSDGSVLDGSGGSTNGSIFIGITGQIQTARAVKILSATGRIKAWTYNGSAWH
ncbi:MAG: prepilin-type N-terminal cleavage/methylation domain-containing protein [Terriglobia bacterium]